MSKKIIVVFGATGAQGGGLARAILQDVQSPFAVRAVTRDVQSPGAQALSRLGAEVVAADLDDGPSVREALKGAYGAFLVTFYWAHFSPEKEKAHAETMARAAAAEGLQHVIWSTLEDTRLQVPLHDDRMPTLMEQYKVPHFDAKGEMDARFTALGLPVTFLRTSFYWENFIHFGMGPKRSADGKLSITFPLGDKKMAGIGAGDIGKAAYGIFKKGPALAGQTIGIAGGHLSGAEMAAAMTAALGEAVHYNAVSPETYRGLGFPGADDLGNMFQYYRDFETAFNASRPIDATRALNPELQSFEQWLGEHAARMPLA